MKRRTFLKASAAAAIGAGLMSGPSCTTNPPTPDLKPPPTEPKFSLYQGDPEKLKPENALLVADRREYSKGVLPGGRAVSVEAPPDIAEHVDEMYQRQVKILSDSYTEVGLVWAPTTREITDETWYRSALFSTVSDGGHEREEFDLVKRDQAVRCLIGRLGSRGDNSFAAAKLLEVLGDDSLPELVATVDRSTGRDANPGTVYGALFAMGNALRRNEYERWTLMDNTERILSSVSDRISGDGNPRVVAEAIRTGSALFAYLGEPERSVLEKTVASVQSDDPLVLERKAQFTEALGKIRTGNKPLTPETFPKSVRGIEKIEWDRVDPNATSTVVFIRRGHSELAKTVTALRRRVDHMNNGKEKEMYADILGRLGRASQLVLGSYRPTLDAFNDLADHGIGVLGSEGLQKQGQREVEYMHQQVRSPRVYRDQNLRAHVRHEHVDTWAEYTHPSIELLATDDGTTVQMLQDIRAGRLSINSLEFDEKQRKRERIAFDRLRERGAPNMMLWFGAGHEFADDARVGDTNFNVVSLWPKGLADSIQILEKIKVDYPDAKLPGVF